MNGLYAVPPPSCAQPVRAPQRWLAVGAAGVEESATFLRRRGRRRTPARAQAEYQQRWTSQGRGTSWLAVTDLQRAVRYSSYGEHRLSAMLEFGAWSLDAPDFFAWRAEKIAAVVGAHADRDDQIVELGCGMGKNLIALAHHGFTRLSGLDPAPAAVTGAAQRLNTLGVPAEIRQGSVLDAASMTPLAEGASVFTNYVMEQLPDDIEAAARTIASCGPRQVLHIEPCCDRLPGRRRWERWPSVWHVRACDYQRSLLQVLHRLEAEGRVRLLEITPLGFSPEMFHSPVLIRWEPVHDR